MLTSKLISRLKTCYRPLNNIYRHPKYGFFKPSHNKLVSQSQNDNIFLNINESLSNPNTSPTKIPSSSSSSSSSSYRLSQLPDLTLQDFILMDKNINIIELRNEALKGNGDGLLKYKKHKKSKHSKNKENSKSEKFIKPFVEYSGLKIEPLNYELYSKSRINEIFSEKLGNSNDLNVNEYIAVSSVLPMRTNNYVVDNLIEWDNVPNDPMFQLTFPQPKMLDEEHINKIVDTMQNMDSNEQSKLQNFITLREEAESIRDELNPHPAGQKELNVPKVTIDNEVHEIPGLQHKYRETVLFFPNESQFCHAFCTYCFRWAQFTSVGSDQAFSSKNDQLLHEYLRIHKDVSDLLFTGGDPMVMTAKQFSKYIDPILTDPKLEHINTIRIGTKSVAYWPYRFVTEDDADDILRLFERIVASGKQLSIMGHYSHWKELSTPVAQEAIRRIRLTGANVRTQSPLIRHVNDDPRVWAEKWRLETRLGAIPYYMFVERDTGARKYFELPLIDGYNIYRDAVSSQSGLGRTVRGPSMSCTPGKVHILGVIDVPSQYNPNKLDKAILLQFLQGRNPNWVGKPFLAKYDPNATWFDDLKPYYDNTKFFFEDELNNITKNNSNSSGQLYEHNIPLDDKIIAPGMTHNMHIDIIKMNQQRKEFSKRQNWNDSNANNK